MQLFAKTLNGKTVVLNVEANASVESVQAQVAEGCTDARLMFAGKQLEEGSSLAEYGIQKESTVHVVLGLAGGKGKKKKKKDFKKPKKNSHRHKNVPMRVLKFYKIEGDGADVKVTHTRMECPHPDCGAGVFMAEHKDRQTCGKCSLTYVSSKK